MHVSNGKIGMLTGLMWLTCWHVPVFGCYQCPIKTCYPVNVSAIYFTILVFAFALMKSNLLALRAERALPVLVTRGPRAVACAAGVCPARPAAAEGWCPPSGCYPQSSRMSVVCTSSPSRSPQSGSQRRLSPGHTEGALLRIWGSFSKLCIVRCTLRT